MNKTRMILMVEIAHHDTCSPQTAIQVVTGALKFPAIERVEVQRAETNYRLFQEPGDEFTPVELP